VNDKDQNVQTEFRIITFASSDERVSKIVDNIPKDMLDQTLEKYIIIGNMVVNYASISESKETMKNTVALINADIFVPLKTEMATFGKQLNMIIPTISKPSKKGDITQETIFRNLKECFMDDSFEDVSKIGKYSDIKAFVSGHDSQISIETKEWTVPITTDQVEKFWRDMEVRDCKYGIFVSMRSNISKISGPIKMETRNGRVAVFVVNSELNWNGHIMAYYAIRKLIELETINRRNTTRDDLVKLIPLVNKKLMEIGKDLKILDDLISLVEELKTSSNKKLEVIRNRISEYKRNVDIEIKDLINDIEKVDVS
jgi:hypothetical protein